uniref:Uncharacterized protein n=1 Tax=Ciona savignyi TaxID=51511 RepID=H2ZN68_CIOSA
MPSQVECTRRLTSPKVVLQLYSTIEVIRKQRQIANLQRVIRVMEKEYGYKPTEILQHIHNAVLDKVVVETITVGCKGSKVGVEQEGYWIPDREQLLSELAVEKHDWYCFRCHDAGLVVPCANCSLVYHPDCLTTLESKNIGPKWRCPWCKKQKQHSTKREKIELSRCLHFVATQQKESIPELQQRPTLEDFAYYDFLIHSHYDLTILQGIARNVCSPLL